MAEKDIAEKLLEAYNDVFADIVNLLLFGMDHWRKPRLSEWTDWEDIPAKLKERIPDYFINVFETAWLEARNLLKMNLSDSQIIQATGLSLSEIQALK